MLIIVYIKNYKLQIGYFDKKKDIYFLYKKNYSIIRPGMKKI